MHFSNMYFVLCQIFGLNHLTPPLYAFFPPPPPPIVSALSLRPEPPFTGVSGPSGPEIAKKSQKRCFGGLQRSPPKNTQKSPKTPKKVRIMYFFRLFRVFFGDFSADPPPKEFLRLFCDFGSGGPGDSCKWRLGSQH